MAARIMPTVPVGSVMYATLLTGSLKRSGMRVLLRLCELDIGSQGGDSRGPVARRISSRSSSAGAATLTSAAPICGRRSSCWLYKHCKNPPRDEDRRNAPGPRACGGHHARLSRCGSDATCVYEERGQALPPRAVTGSTSYPSAQPVCRPASPTYALRQLLVTPRARDSGSFADGSASFLGLARRSSLHLTGLAGSLGPSVSVRRFVYPSGWRRAAREHVSYSTGKCQVPNAG